MLCKAAAKSSCLSANIKSLQIQTANEVDKINNWINANKLTINYKKSCFVLVGNKQATESDFNLSINYIKIEQSDHVKYLGVHLDSYHGKFISKN